MFRLCNWIRKVMLREASAEVKKTPAMSGRFRKVKRYAAAAGISIMSAGICIMGAGMECRAETEVLTVNPPVCADDEYVLISVGDNYAEIYDGQGNYISKCRAYTDVGYNVYTIKKDYVLEYTDDKTCSIFSMADLKNILTFPTEQYQLQVSAGLVLATEKVSGSVFLYDNHGTLLYQCSGKAISMNESVQDSTAADGDCQGRILTLDSGYLIGSCRFTDNDNLLTAGPVWISKDRKESREMTDPYLGVEFANWRLEAFGDYLMVYNWESESGGVYDLDGNLLLEPVVSHFSEYLDDSWSYAYNSGNSFHVSLVMQSGDDMCYVYNSQLEECAIVPVSEEGYWDYGYAGGFFQGAAYRQLDGRTCDGFVQYKNSSWCPYAKTEDGVLVYADGEKNLIPVEDGSYIVSLNESYMITGCYREDSYEDRLISRKTGEILEESRWSEDGNLYFVLGTDYCIITENFGGDEDYRTSVTIMDDQNQIRYQADNDLARTWKNGYMVLDRGIYHGIADIDGNWIIKTIAGWTE